MPRQHRAVEGKGVSPALLPPLPHLLHPIPAPALLRKAFLSLSPLLSPPAAPSLLAGSQECVMVPGSNFIFKMLLSKI